MLYFYFPPHFNLLLHFKEFILKKLAISFLLLFVAFLIIPTTVTLIKQNVDISYVFNFSEEEEHNSNSDESDTAEGVWKLFYEGENIFVFRSLLKKSFIPFYFFSDEIIYFDLLLPPPELA